VGGEQAVAMAEVAVANRKGFVNGIKKQLGALKNL
jgi:hypothetical protein